MGRRVVIEFVGVDVELRIVYVSVNKLAVVGDGLRARGELGIRILGVVAVVNVFPRNAVAVLFLGNLLAAYVVVRLAENEAVCAHRRDVVCRAHYIVIVVVDIRLPCERLARAAVIPPVVVHAHVVGNRAVRRTYKVGLMALGEIVV